MSQMDWILITSGLEIEASGFRPLSEKCIQIAVLFATVLSAPVHRLPEEARSDLAKQQVTTSGL
jgi:hypothetical protein